MLCIFCQNVLSGGSREALNKLERIPHHPSPSSLCAAANEGCQICLILRSRFSRDFEIDLLQFWSEAGFSSVLASSEVLSDGDRQFEAYGLLFCLVHDASDKFLQIDNDETWSRNIYMQPLQGTLSISL